VLIKKLNKKEREKLKADIDTIFLSSKLKELVLKDLNAKHLNSNLNIPHCNQNNITPIINEELKNKYGLAFLDCHVSWVKIFIYRDLTGKDLTRIINNEINIIEYLLSSINFEITLYGRKYEIIYNAYLIAFNSNNKKPDRISICKIIARSTQEEILEKREKNETNYAVIKKDGKKALVKFIAGDREVINASKFIKIKEVEGMSEEESLVLLFKLNNNIDKK